MSKTLVICCGPSGSGKTTFVSNMEQPDLWINRDFYVDEFAKKHGLTWDDMINNRIHPQAEADLKDSHPEEVFRRSIDEAINGDKEKVVVDYPLNAKNAVEIIGRAKKAGREVVVKVIQAETTEAWRRVVNRHINDEKGESFLEKFFPEFLDTHKKFTETFKAITEVANVIEVYETTQRNSPPELIAKKKEGELEIHDERKFLRCMRKEKINLNAEYKIVNTIEDEHGKTIADTKIDRLFDQKAFQLENRAKNLSNGEINNKGDGRG